MGGFLRRFFGNRAGSKYSQYGSPLADKGPGTRVGLSIVCRIVNAVLFHGARLHVEIGFITFCM